MACGRNIRWRIMSGMAKLERVILPRPGQLWVDRFRARLVRIVGTDLRYITVKPCGPYGEFLVGHRRYKIHRSLFGDAGSEGVLYTGLDVVSS